MVAAGGVFTYARPRPEKIKQPTLRYEQTAGALKVFIHNPNKTWGLRDQHILVIFVGEERNILRSYGPDEHFLRTNEPGLNGRCCVITALPPRGDYVFTFSSVGKKVAGVTMDPDPAPKWVHWQATPSNPRRRVSRRG